MAIKPAFFPPPTLNPQFPYCLSMTKLRENFWSRLLMKSTRFFKGLSKDHARKSHSITGTLSEQHGSEWKPALAIAPIETGTSVGI
jgi:hypothetical protein